MGPIPRYRLDESLLPSEIYNTLPHIDLDGVYEREQKQSAARTALLNVISEHGVDNVFSIHLLHRHYSLPAHQVMVYEQNPQPDDQNLPFFEVCRPRSIDSLSKPNTMRGKFFFYRPDTETMSAYEYTTEACVDIASVKYGNFIDDFTRQLLSMDMQTTFALSISSPSEKRRVLHEIEIPEYQATLRLEKSSWVPDGFNTDWVSRAGQVDGIYNNAGGIREATTGGKHGVSCKTPKHSSIGFIKPVTDSTSCGIVWDEERLEESSTAYQVISRARELIVFS